MPFNIPSIPHPRIVIIGGGFAGMELAKRLRNQPFQVVLFDRHNYHTFQPLLYQVATGGLRVDSIASPLRKVFHKMQNISFRMEEIIGIDPSKNWVERPHGRLDFD